MAKEKSKTVKALALQSGGLFLDGNVKQFKEGDALMWPADDAERSANSGVILIDEPAPKGK